MIEKDITILIPTHNRKEYLNRILDYLSKSEFQIIVCDSSFEPFPYLDKYPNINYKYYGNISMMDKLLDGIRQISSKYTVMCADDDFVILSAIIEGADFLENNTDYVSVLGNFVSFQLCNDEVGVSPIYRHSIEMDINEETPFQRVSHFFSNYIQVFYAITNTKILIETYELVHKYQLFNYVLVELLMGYITTLNGKLKVLPVFWGAREDSIPTYSNIHHLDVISNNSKYADIYARFVACCGEQLNKHKFISDNINESVLEIFSPYIKKISKKKKYNLIPDFLKRIILSSSLYNNYKKNQINKLVSKYKETKGFPFGGDKRAEKDMIEIEKFILKHNV